MALLDLLDTLITRESVVHAFRREDAQHALRRPASRATHNVARQYTRNRTHIVRAKAAELREFSLSQLVLASGSAPSRVREMMKTFRAKGQVSYVRSQLTAAGGIEKVWRWNP